MHKFTMALLAGSALALGACGGNKANTATANTSNLSTTNMTAEAAGPTSTAGAASVAAWPEGARIVEDNGVTYRVEASGARVRLAATDSRIVTEGGVRYRVDPDGSRVRITPDGLRIGDSVIRGNAPNGRSDVETPGEAATDAGEDAVEAVGDLVPD